MKFKDWITYEFPSDEIIQGGSNRNMLRSLVL